MRQRLFESLQICLDNAAGDPASLTGGAFSAPIDDLERVSSGTAEEAHETAEALKG